jgi:two-component system sensor histidine kinase KdpD
MTEVAGPEFLFGTAGKQLGEIFDGEVVIYARESPGAVTLRFGSETSVAKHEINAVVAQWVADHDQVAGAGTDTLPNATALFVTLTGSQRTLGTIGVRPKDSERFSDPEQRRLLETCASLIALSLERDQSVLEATEAELRVQTEQMRNSLLSSVSHDLRTPLAAIAGASSSLLESRGDERGETRKELLQTIAEESSRMTRLVDNLLDMTRLESGNLSLNRQWHVLEEIVGSALAHLRRELGQRTVSVDIPPDFPLLPLDGVLMEQVFVNLLENAARYTPPGSRIEITAGQENGSVEILVADNGPGLPPGSEARVFEKFYRAAPMPPDSRRGVGLGLAICQAIIRAHGGDIRARNRSGSGAEFLLRLPCKEPAPRVALDHVVAHGGV